VSAGIRLSLELLSKQAMAYRLAPWTRKIVVPSLSGVGDTVVDRTRQRILDIIEVLHRQGAPSLHAPSEALQVVGSEDTAEHVPMDADDACLFVASCALSIGIPCRFVARRYNRSWTVRLGYEVTGRWETIDCTRQSADRIPDEEIVGEELRG
jgi:hypothetical protein